MAPLWALVLTVILALLMLVGLVWAVVRRWCDRRELRGMAAYDDEVLLDGPGDDRWTDG